MDANNLMKLPNVELGVRLTKDLNGEQIVSYRIHEGLVRTIAPLAIAKPHWRFVVSDGYRESAFEVTAFDIKQESETLGKVSIERSRNGGRCIAIRNHRISDALERGDARRTIDPAKAIAIIKKTFGKRSVSELVDVAATRTRSGVGTAVYAKNRIVQEKLNELSPYLLSFALDEEFRPMFTAYVQQKTNSTNLIDNLEHAQREQKIIKKLDKAHGSGDTYLTLLDGDRIIVAKGEDIQSYTDETLPDWMRGKIGLMKLATDGQAVDNCGMRFEDKVFVIMPE